MKPRLLSASAGAHDRLCAAGALGVRQHGEGVTRRTRENGAQGESDEDGRPGDPGASWVHGVGDGELMLVTPAEMTDELDAVLESARASVVFERVSDG